jgi:hypothetical protein
MLLLRREPKPLGDGVLHHAPSGRAARVRRSTGSAIPTRIERGPR